MTRTYKFTYEYDTQLGWHECEVEVEYTWHKPDRENRSDYGIRVKEVTPSVDGVDVPDEVIEEHYHKMAQYWIDSSEPEYEGEDN